jgi:hypothetical protein
MKSIFSFHFLFCPCFVLFLYFPFDLNNPRTLGLYIFNYRELIHSLECVQLQQPPPPKKWLRFPFFGFVFPTIVDACKWNTQSSSMPCVSTVVRTEQTRLLFRPEFFKRGSVNFGGLIWPTRGRTKKTSRLNIPQLSKWTRRNLWAVCICNS